MTDDPALDMGVEVEIKGENNDKCRLADFNYRRVFLGEGWGVGGCCELSKNYSFVSLQGKCNICS